MAMFYEIVRIGFAIALDVWSVRIIRVRPPVLALGIEIMQPARTPLAVKRGNRDRVVTQKFFSSFPHGFAQRGDDLGFYVRGWGKFLCDRIDRRDCRKCQGDDPAK